MEICKDFFIYLQCTRLPSTRLMKVCFQRSLREDGFGTVQRLMLKTFGFFPPLPSVSLEGTAKEYVCRGLEELTSFCRLGEKGTSVISVISQRFPRIVFRGTVLAIPGKGLAHFENRDLQEQEKEIFL